MYQMYLKQTLPLPLHPHPPAGQKDIDSILATATTLDPSPDSASTFVPGIDVPDTEPKRQNELRWSMDSVSAFTVPTHAATGQRGVGGVGVGVGGVGGV